MTEEIRFIVKELAKEPFKKNFSVITFDSMKPEQLLQVLNDVLAEIDPSQNIDIREESVDETVVRMLFMLRVLKYKPPENDPTILRSGLINGNSKIIHPIFSWLLPRINELKTRAYLAKYLVKVDVPQEIRADIEVEELYQQYEELMEQFKVTHKQLETLKAKGFTTSEIRKDIEAMEQEQESVTRKIEKLKRQTESMPNLDSTLKVVQEFRKEKEKSRELDQQRLQQTQAVAQAEQRIQRLQRQLKDVRETNSGATAEGLLQRIEQDVDTTKLIVNQKFPQEITTREKEIALFERILSETTLSTADLEDTRQRLDDVKKEVNDLVMKRMLKSEDNNLLMFRQQAAIVTNKKSSLIEKLNELRAEANSLKDEVTDKKTRLSTLQGDAMLKEEDFKEYVKNLRVKSTRYKQMKLELTGLKAESNILSKTIFVLEEQLRNSVVDLAALEARLGVKGFSEMQENIEKLSSEKSGVDEEKAKNLEAMSSNVQELRDQIEAKKMDLSPLVKTLNKIRQDAQIMSHEHEAQKRKYDAAVGKIEASLTALTEEHEKLTKKYEADQLRICVLQAEMNILKVDIKRMEDELKNYATAGGNNQDRKKSYKEQLNDKIGEQERQHNALKEEERQIVGKQVERAHQARMWKDLKKILELKITSRQASDQ